MSTWTRARALLAMSRAGEPTAQAVAFAVYSDPIGLSPAHPQEGLQRRLACVLADLRRTLG